MVYISSTNYQKITGYYLSFLTCYLRGVEHIKDYLKHNRKQYDAGILTENHLEADPLLQFNHWLDAALKAGIEEPNAMDLSTVSADGRPSSRIVLLRNCDERGFVFFTNYESRKGKELIGNKFACLNFFWPAMARQVRVEGLASRLPEKESDDYFRTRPRESQLGAWASSQSEFLTSRKELEDSLLRLSADYEGREVPRPPHWGGFVLEPDRIEFWQGRPNRLHDRFLYERNGSEWMVLRLFP